MIDMAVEWVENYVVPFCLYSQNCGHRGMCNNKQYCGVTEGQCVYNRCPMCVFEKKSRLGVRNVYLVRVIKHIYDNWEVRIV